MLKSGVRELDLVKNYTGHEYDAVLDQFYAKYRMYDASDRRFTTIDPIRDGLNWYIYVENNPVMYVDPLGLVKITVAGITVDVTTAISGSDIDGSGDIYLTSDEALRIHALFTNTNLHSPINTVLQRNPNSTLKRSNTKATTTGFVKDHLTLSSNFGAPYAEISVSIDGYLVNDIYFVKLSCLEQLLGGAGLGVEVTDKSNIFRSSDYTSLTAETRIEGFANDLLLYGKFDGNLNPFSNKSAGVEYSYMWYRLSRTYRNAAKEKAYAMKADETLMGDTMGQLGSMADSYYLVKENASPHYSNTKMVGFSFLAYLYTEAVITAFGGYDYVEPTGGALIGWIGERWDSLRDTSKTVEEAVIAISRYLFIEETDYRYVLTDLDARSSFNEALGSEFNQAKSDLGIFSVFAEDYLNTIETRLNDIMSMNGRKLSDIVTEIGNSDVDLYTDERIKEEMKKIFDAKTSDLTWATW